MKRPDNFVEDKIVKSYPTEIGSQNFKPDDISLFKLEKTTKVKKYYSTKFEEIATQYELLMKDIQINERLYKSNHNFEPVTGEIYNLYKKQSGEEFISIISPDEWSNKFEFIGKFQFTSESRWVEVF
jgi:hypothetical protein